MARLQHRMALEAFLDNDWLTIKDLVAILWPNPNTSPLTAEPIAYKLIADLRATGLQIFHRWNKGYTFWEHLCEDFDLAPPPKPKVRFLKSNGMFLYAESIFHDR